MTKILSTVVSVMLIGASTQVAAGGTSVGVGMGSNYGGVIGTVFNSEVGADTEAFGGIGFSGDIGYVVGGRYYVSDSVRLIANYGTNSIVEVSSGEYEGFEGFNVGVGYVGSSRDGWTVDLMYADASKAQDKVTELRNQGYVMSDADDGIRLSFGYRW